MDEKFLSSSHPVMPNNLKEAPVAETPSKPEDLQSSSSSSLAITATSPSKCDESSSSEEEEAKPITSLMAPGTNNMHIEALDEKVAVLVNFLLLKYQMKEIVRKEDILKFIIREQEDHFPEILMRASERLEIIFGLDVKEVDPTNHCYGLFIKLGLTYDGMQNDEDSVPKTGLLILILGVIFMKGNSATEEEIWEVLNMTGIYSGKQHFIFGDTKELITKDFVKEKYLEYQQVANTDPVQYEFLWGAGAHAETSKMKVLEFVAKVHGTDRTAFLSQYEEALLEDEGGALTTILSL
jgi:hypothetical protein